MKKISTRQARVAEGIKKVISKTILEGLSDPRVSSLTITEVEVSADISVAHIFITVFEKEKLEETLKGLNSAVPHFRHKIAKELNLKFTPNLEFFYDESIERGAKIEALIDSLRKAK